MKRHKKVTGIIKFIEGLEGDHSQLEIKLKFKRQRLQSLLKNIPV
jgi:hypothetical protein